MYNSKLKSQAMDNLCRAILSLKTVEECYQLFDDLCTISEIQSLSQRFEVAVMLDKGMTYNDISKNTGASTATISRINRCLNYGADGYRVVLERLEEKND